MTRPFLLCVALIFTCTISSAQAQINELEQSRYNRASFYSYSEPGDVTIRVSAWGSVRNPGLYEIPRETSLTELFSLAGGPSSIGQRGWREDQTLIVRLTRRQENGERTVVYEKRMEEEIATLDENIAIQNGDILTAETIVDRRLTWWDAFTVIGAASTAFITLDRLGLFGN